MSLICQCFAFSNATMHARSEGRSMPLVESEGEYKTVVVKLYFQEYTYSRRQQNAPFPSRYVLLSIPSCSVLFSSCSSRFFSHSIPFRFVLSHSVCRLIQGTLG